MAIEHAAVQVARKPWGVADLQPWSSMDGSGDPIGELWFQRVDKNAPTPALLLKLLFTSEPLSIQVHPDDEFARSIGLPNGKTEAWYILSAAPGARVARRVEAASHAAAIARVDQGRLDCRSRAMAPGCKEATSSSSLPARSTPSAPVSCLPKFSSAATRRSACSITAGSASCTKRAPSLFPMPGLLELKPFTTPHRRANGLSSQARISCSSGSIFRRIRAGCSTADEETWMLVIEGRARIGATKRDCRRRHLCRSRACQHRSRARRDERPDRLSRTGPHRFPAARSWRANDQICRHVRAYVPKSNENVEAADMTPLRRIAVIGNSLPRRCGIATFTTDLQQAISTSRPNWRPASWR